MNALDEEKSKIPIEKKQLPEGGPPPKKPKKKMSEAALKALEKARAKRKSNAEAKKKLNLPTRASKKKPKTKLEKIVDMYNKDDSMFDKFLDGTDADHRDTPASDLHPDDKKDKTSDGVTTDLQFDSTRVEKKLPAPVKHETFFGSDHDLMKRFDRQEETIRQLRQNIDTLSDRVKRGDGTKAPEVVNKQGIVFW